MDFFIQSLLHPNSSTDFLKDIIYIQSFSNDNYNDSKQKDPFNQYDRQALNRKYDRVDTFLLKNAIHLKKNTKKYKKEEGYSINPYENRNLYGSNQKDYLDKMIDQTQNVLPAEIHPTEIQKSFQDHEFDYKLHNLLRSGIDIFKIDQVKRRRIVKKPSTIIKPCQCCGKQSHHRHKCLHIFCEKKCGKVRSRSRPAHHTQSKQDFNSQSYEEDSSDYQLQFSKTKKQPSEQEQSSAKYQIFQPSQALIKSIDQLLLQPYDLDFSYKVIQIKEFIEQKQNSNENNSNNSNNEQQNIDIFNKYNVVERDKISEVQSKSQISESRRNNSIKQVLKSVYSNSEQQVSNQPHYNLLQVVQKNGQDQQKHQQNANNKSQNQAKSKTNHSKSARNLNNLKTQNKKSSNNQVPQDSSSDEEKINQKINQVQKLQQSDKQNQESKAKESMSKNQKQQQQDQQQDQLSYDSDFKKLLAVKSRGGDLEITEREFQCGSELQKLYMRNRLSSKISVGQQDDTQKIDYYEDQLQKLLNQNSQLKKRQRFQSQQLVEYDILIQQDYKEQEKLKVFQNQQNKPKSQELQIANQQQHFSKGLGRGKGTGMGSGLGIFENQLFMDQEEHHNDQQFNLLINRYSSNGSRESNKRERQGHKKRNQKMEKLAIKQIEKKQNLSQIKEKLKHLIEQQKILYQNQKGLGHGKGFGMGHGMGMAYEQQLQLQIQQEKNEKISNSSEEQIEQKE